MYKGKKPVDWDRKEYETALFKACKQLSTEDSELIKMAYYFDVLMWADINDFEDLKHEPKRIREEEVARIFERIALNYHV